MSVSSEQMVDSAAKVDRSVVGFVRDLISLTKPRLSGLVLFTTAGGMWLSRTSLPWWQWAVTMLATAGTVGAANAFNCYIERDSDRFMARTAVRPLPQSRMEPIVALVFAALLALASVPVLFLGVNPLTGVLGVVALASYVLVYTPMKSRTHWAMVVGAIPGALPPLMGWTAATGKIEVPGLVLFGILFFWQLPHFIAIALFRKAEYRAAGLTSLPLEKGDDVARAHAVLYLLALLPVSVLPFVVGVAGWIYLAAAVVLGAGFFWVAFDGWRRKGDAAWARKLFGVSLGYLTGVFAALGVSPGL
ncbi:MAG: protoheme IX farnesyltransferase [Archangiaceae bacterium]|nr:protoheme IX farnesyltransferase [Archangiaceae bacterium]